MLISVPEVLDWVPQKTSSRPKSVSILPDRAHFQRLWDLIEARMVSTYVSSAKYVDRPQPFKVVPEHVTVLRV